MRPVYLLILLMAFGALLLQDHMIQSKTISAGEPCNTSSVTLPTTTDLPGMLFSLLHF